MTHLRSLAVGALLASATASADDHAAGQVDDDTFAVDRRAASSSMRDCRRRRRRRCRPACRRASTRASRASCGCHFAYGARASWSTSPSRRRRGPSITTDLRLRATGSMRHDAGRGTSRCGSALGPTIVHEVRDAQRARWKRANRSATRACDTVPAGDLEAVFAVHVAGPWLAVASGGPVARSFRRRARRLDLAAGSRMATLKIVALVARVRLRRPPGLRRRGAAARDVRRRGHRRSRRGPAPGDTGTPSSARRARVGPAVARRADLHPAPENARCGRSDRRRLSRSVRLRARARRCRTSPVELGRAGDARSVRAAQRRPPGRRSHRARRLREPRRLRRSRRRRHARRSAARIALRHGGGR